MVDIMTPLVRLDTPIGNVAKVLGRKVLMKAYRYVADADTAVPPDGVTLAWFLVLADRDDKDLLSLPGIGPAKSRVIRQLSNFIDDGRVWEVPAVKLR